MASVLEQHGQQSADCGVNATAPHQQGCLHTRHAIWHSFMGPNQSVAAVPKCSPSAAGDSGAARRAALHAGGLGNTSAILQDGNSSRHGKVGE